jgi:hypothetical protein
MLSSSAKWSSVDMVAPVLGVIGSADRVACSEITKPHFLDGTLREDTFWKILVSSDQTLGPSKTCR